MNILYIPAHNKYLSFYSESHFWRELLEAYKKLGDVYVVVPHADYGGMVKVTQLYGVEVTGVGVDWTPFHPRIPCFGLAQKVFKYLNRNEIKIDLVVCQKSLPFGNFANSLATKLKVKSIIHEHSGFEKTNSEGTQFYLKGWVDGMRVLALQRADIVICPSETLKNHLAKYSHRKKKVFVVYNPLQKAFSEAIGTSRIAKNESKYFVAIATWNPGKRLDRLIDAWSELDEQIKEGYTLKIIGDIPEKQLKIIESKGGGISKIDCLGRLNSKEVQEILSKAYCYILPSDFETFSLPVAEAMALKVPVVATKCGAPEELLADGRGIVTTCSVEGLRSALKNIILNGSGIDLERSAQWIKENTSVLSVSKSIKLALISRKD